MKVRSDYKEQIDRIKVANMRVYANVNALLDLAILTFQDLYGNYESALESKEQEHMGYILKITRFVKSNIFNILDAEDSVKTALYYKVLLFEAPFLFESYIFYMEHKRKPEKRFYEPRRNVLHIVAQDLQDLAYGKIEFYGLSMPPRTGKSTICIFFVTWLMGRNPNSHNAMGGHSGILADGFYTEALNLIGTEEYAFYDIFPRARPKKTTKFKSADSKEITLGSPDRFATLTCRGVDGTWTGAIDVSSDGLLYVDDMIRDRTESLSPKRLENRYQDYLNVMVDRKNDGSKELMVGTRWNILDPLGRVEAENKNNYKYRFRKIPALNKRGESNFQYKFGKGFSTEYYLKLKRALDKNEWEAKYQQRPFKREGLMFVESEMHTYNGVLPPEEEFVRVLSVADVAWGGGDSFSMPIGLEYTDNRVFIHAWMFDGGTKEVTIPRVLSFIKKYKIQSINFEANNGGDMYAKYISDKLKEDHISCNVTSSRAPNQMSKMAKIEQYAPDIKNNFYFLEEEYRTKEYQAAMDEVFNFAKIGKNPHDDAPDSLAQLAARIEGGFKTVARIMKGLF